MNIPKPKMKTPADELSPDEIIIKALRTELSSYRSRYSIVNKQLRDLQIQTNEQNDFRAAYQDLDLNFKAYKKQQKEILEKKEDELRQIQSTIDRRVENLIVSEFDYAEMKRKLTTKDGLLKQLRGYFNRHVKRNELNSHVFTEPEFTIISELIDKGLNTTPFQHAIVKSKNKIW